MLNRAQYFTEQVTQLLPVGVGSKVKFQEQPNLEGVCVLGIEAFTSSQWSTDTQGRTIISAADSLKVAVSFFDKQTDRISRIPYSQMVAANLAGMVRQFDGLSVNWPKSFVELGTAPGTLPCVLVFAVHYLPWDTAERLGLAKPVK